MTLPPIPTPTPEQSHDRVTRTPGRFSGSVSPQNPTSGRRPATLAKTLLALVTAAVTTVVVAAPAAAKLVWIPRDGHRIAAYVQPGRGPAIVLSHGFPDNHHLYDRVVPLLKGHEVVTFDFLGWGQSSKPAHYAYTFASQEQDQRRHRRPSSSARRPGGPRRERARGAQLDARSPRSGRITDPLQRLLRARPRIRAARAGRDLRARSVPEHGTARTAPRRHRLRAPQPHERPVDRSQAP